MHFLCRNGHTLNAEVGRLFLCRCGHAHFMHGGHTLFYAEVSRCFVYKGGQALFYSEVGTSFFSSNTYRIGE